MKPRFTLRVEFARFVFCYSPRAKDEYGTCFLIATRKWLNPGVFVWRVALREGKKRKVREWRSVWRRPLPHLNGPPLYGPFERVKRRS